MMRSFSKIEIDAAELFKRSTLRNRCTIINANGPLLLTIPISGGRRVRGKTRDVRIHNADRWQHQHWRSMMAAYGKSSFFIYYEEQLRSFYEKKFEFLIDFNSSLLEACFAMLGWKKTIANTSEDDHGAMLRKHELFNYDLPPYHQVFEQKLGFVPNASIVDLIFNLGPDASLYLQATR